MRDALAVTALYLVALFEGEGMGTAYEYSVKIKLLRRLTADVRPLRRMLIGGIPEAYGFSLDLALVAALYGCQVVVAEDRVSVLEGFANALRSPQLKRWIDPACFEMRPIEALARVTRTEDPVYDLWVSTSAIQRLDGDGLAAYLAQVRVKSRYALLMAPNSDNRAHLTLTKLRGFTLSGLGAVCQEAGLVVRESGYLDLPPFPPGIKRSTEAKEKAAKSKLERFAMGGLEWWARGERVLPRFAKRRWAHLVYAFVHA